MKNDSYVLFSANGTIVKNSPDVENNPKESFNQDVRVFGPFKNVPTPVLPAKNDNKNDDSEPVQEISYDEGGNPLPPVDNSAGISDSLSGGVGAMILGPIIGQALGNALHLNPAAAHQLTDWIEKGIHVGLDAVEISDSSNKKPSQQINNISDQNMKNLIINNRGNISNIQDLNQNMKVFNASKEQSTSSVNMTAQQKFDAKHRVFGKKS